MSYYEFLNKYKGVSRQKPYGQPNLRQTKITVPVEAGNGDYKFEQNSEVERHVGVGLWVTKAGVKTDLSHKQISGVAFDSAYITLRHQSEEVYKKISLAQIYACNSQRGLPYYVSLPGAINMSQSSLIIPDNAAIGANEVAELMFDYIAGELK